MHRRPHAFSAAAAKSARLALCGLGLIWTCTAAHSQGLLDIVQTARSYDATYLAARAQHSADQAKADQGRSAWRPQIGLKATDTETDTRVQNVDTKTDSRKVTLAASQPLIRVAQFMSAAQAEKSRALALAQLNYAEQDLLVRTARAYFDVLIAHENVTFVRAQKQAVEQQLAAAQRNFEVGTATITDTREAQARFDLVTAQEIANNNEYQIKQLALNNLVGRQDLRPWPLNEQAPLPGETTQTLDQWLALALEQNPQLLMAKVAHDIARLETSRAQAAHLPTLDLVASRTQSHSTKKTTTTTVEFELNIPLYSGGATHNRVAEAVALEEKKRHDLEGTQRSVEQLTREIYLGLNAARGQVQALEASAKSSLSALEANQLGYQVGVRINIDVLNAQSQLYQTKASLAKARFDYLIAHLRLKQVAGALAMDDLQPIEALLAKP